SFWSEQVRVLYHLNQPRERRRDLNYLYRQLEDEFIEKQIPVDGWDIVGALGGYRSGKSTTGARWIHNSALERPGTRWLVMGQDFAKAKKTTYKVLFQNLPGEMTHVLTSNHNGPETSPIIADYSRRDNVLTYRNGSQVVLGSADDPGRHAGDEFHGAWLDEPSLYGQDLHQIRRMIGSRLSTGPPAVQLWTFTGNGMDGNAAYEIMEKRQDENEDTLNANIHVVKLNVLKNPFILPSTKRKLRRQYEGTNLEEQGLYGGYAPAEGRVYGRFNRNDHVLPAAEADVLADDEFRFYGYDAGWSDPRVVLELGTTPYGQILVLDEFYRSESHVEEAIKWLKGELGLSGRDRPKGRIWSEHEPEDITKFRRAGFEAYPANKSLNAGIPAVRRRFGEDSEGNVGLLIADRCEKLISEVQSYKEEEIGTKAAEDHAADALRYAVMGYDEGPTSGSSGGGSSSVEKA
ncbi:MAG: terminase large subunit domain-containing protein, partial [Candidatus Wenzhouxiangella sp. M2_3B_020]